uniref:ENTH domain-containing protein n=1 Tax=Kalanchoe fedtschenkoi TaxID=63787 RepID=A0A7N0ZSS0_KALFE
MALRKAIGTVKDQTSIGLAKVASNLAPDLEVAVVKATSHDEDPVDEKYVRAIASLISRSSGHVHACVAAVARRLSKTKDWVVALKSLILVHRLLCEGDPLFQQELMCFTRKGGRVLNMSGFRDEAHSNGFDHSAFVRTYAMYLDQKLELLMFERKGRGGGSLGGRGDGDRFEREDRWRSSPERGGAQDYDYGRYRDEPVSGMRRSRSYGDVKTSAGREGRDERRPATPLQEMVPGRIFVRMSHLQRLLDRFLACRPTGLARNCRMVLIALYPVVKESFQLYADICEVLAVLLDKFFDMEYEDSVKAYEAYAGTARQIDDLIAFYGWCKDTGVARSSEYPEVQRITGKLLETLEEFLRDRLKRQKNPEKIQEAPPVLQEEEPVLDMNEIKALPAPESYAPPPPPPAPKPEPQVPQVTGDLVDLRDDSVSANDQGNQLALALFAGPPTNGSWEAFPSNGQPEVTSAWQTPAAEPGKADWELALVESASNLARQKPALGGGLDPLLLNGMYDQGIVRQHVSTAQLTGGSASSVAMPGPKSSTPVLALPAPDGTVQTVGQDPFAASLTIPPPSYVQMADMEKKQVLLTQEQLLWQQYAREGMQGPATLAKLSGQTYYGEALVPMMPYGMPPVNGVGPPAGFGYSPY